MLHNIHDEMFILRDTRQRQIGYRFSSLIFVTTTKMRSQVYSKHSASQDTDVIARLWNTRTTNIAKSS
jgi:hypothetical protein